MNANSVGADTVPSRPRFVSRVDVFAWVTFGLVIVLGLVAAPVAVLYLTTHTHEPTILVCLLALPAAALKAA